jgi:hypothetical protein
MIRITVLCAAIAACLSCASVSQKPAQTPAAAPVPSAPQALWLGVDPLPGWYQAPGESGSMVIKNDILGAQVLVVMFPMAQGGPRDTVGWIMVKLMSDGLDIVETQLTPADKEKASLRFRGTMNGQPTGGKVAAKVSNQPEVGILFFGLWPADKDQLVLTQFDQLFDSAHFVSR